MSDIKTVLVTGASGFLGSHIVQQLLDGGYTVKAAARAAKLAALHDAYAPYGARIIPVPTIDVASDDFRNALQDVDAIIHTAAPLPHKLEPGELLDRAVEGTLNIVRQACEAGVRSVVVTSSIATVLTPGMTLSDKDWYPATKEDATKGSPMDAYRAAKTLAERALWDFADAHPEMEITTLNPPYFYGPFAPTFSLPTPDPSALSTNTQIHRLLTPSGEFPPFGRHIDIRDCARAHVLALHSPPASQVGRKRLPIASPHAFAFSHVVELIRAQRPELRARVLTRVPPEREEQARTGDLQARVDFGRVSEVLGMREAEFRTVEETVLGAVDGLVALERLWASKGFDVSNVSGFGQTYQPALLRK